MGKHGKHQMGDCDCHGHRGSCGCGRHEGHSECSCGCGEGRRGGGHGFQRRYQTKAEEIAELEGYLGELKAEVQAVEERLTSLR